jgi:hypothetical protein
MLLRSSGGGAVGAGAVGAGAFGLGAAFGFAVLGAAFGSPVFGSATRGSPELVPLLPSRVGPRASGRVEGSSAGGALVADGPPSGGRSLRPGGSTIGACGSAADARVAFARLA